MNYTFNTFLVPNEDILEEDERRISDENGKKILSVSIIVLVSTS